jgi:hypothetical protein
MSEEKQNSADRFDWASFRQKPSVAAPDSSRRRLYLAAFTVLALVVATGGLVIYGLSTDRTTPVQRKSEEIVVRNGDSRFFTEVGSFTFWKTVIPSDIQPRPDAEYALLSTDQEKELLASAVIKAPDGLTVRTMSMDLKTEPRETEFGIGKPTFRQTFRVKYQAYVVNGEWEVSVPKDFPEGLHTVEIVFTAIPKLKKELDALHPNHEVALGFRFRTQIAE